MSNTKKILWISTAGILTATFWFLFGIIFCISIIGIPLGKQAFRMAKWSLMPFDITVTDTKKGNNLESHKCPYCGQTLSPDPADDTKTLCYSCRKRFKISDLEKLEQSSKLPVEASTNPIEQTNQQDDTEQLISLNESETPIQSVNESFEQKLKSGIKDTTSIGGGQIRLCSMQRSHTNRNLFMKYLMIPN